MILATHLSLVTGYGHCGLRHERFLAVSL